VAFYHPTSVLQHEVLYGIGGGYPLISYACFTLWSQFLLSKERTVLLVTSKCLLFCATL